MASRSGSLPEVPWVMGDPNASYKWQVSVAGGKKRDKKKKPKPKKLENIVISIYPQGKKKSIHLKFLKTRIEEDFNSIVMSSILLRALHFSKLKNVIRIIADSEVLHDNKTHSFSQIIKLLDDFEIKGANYNHVEIEAIIKPENLTKINIERVHKKGQPPITIAILGKLHKEKLDRIISYIKKHASIDSIQY
jgi:DNA-directed RNA polymerase beta subunit